MRPARPWLVPLHNRELPLPWDERACGQAERHAGTAVEHQNDRVGAVLAANSHPLVGPAELDVHALIDAVGRGYAQQGLRFVQTPRSIAEPGSECKHYDSNEGEQALEKPSHCYGMSALMLTTDPIVLPKQRVHLVPEKQETFLALSRGRLRAARCARRKHTAFIDRTARAAYGSSPCRPRARRSSGGWCSRLRSGSAARSSARHAAPCGPGAALRCPAPPVTWDVLHGERFLIIRSPASQPGPAPPIRVIENWTSLLNAAAASP